MQTESTKLISEIIIKNKDKIMSNFVERAYKEIAAAQGTKTLVLENMLAEFILELSEALTIYADRKELGHKIITQQSFFSGIEHGKFRAQNANYTLDQMISEYHILRQVIFKVLEEEETQIADKDRDIIITAIEQAVNAAATQFSHTLITIQQNFTRTLAHDIRNNITSAKLYAQLILKRPENVEDVIKEAGLIVKTLNFLDSMIRDLLDASRLGAGEGLHLVFEEFDLSEHIKQMIDEFKSIYGDHFVLISSGAIVGYWCKNGIHRIIENLVSNAIKYGTQDSPITITLKQNDSLATLSVHNEGIPITPEDQSLLFEQFRRSKSSEKKDGWGLGLFIVKGIVEEHKGKIFVQSIENFGTELIVELPLDMRKLLQ